MTSERQTLTSETQAVADFTLRIKMESDWHVGTGAGIPGGIDRAVTRDALGLPMIPAKTVTGILRDACECAARTLDLAEDHGSWSHLVESLFGSQPGIGEASGEKPREAALKIRPARLSLGIRAAFAARTPQERLAHCEALTFLKPGVEVEDATGLAKDDHLRFIEMARQGLVLFAEAHLDLSDKSAALHHAATGLLVAGTCLAERLGGKRRRGGGRCAITIEGIDKDPALASLEAICPDLDPPRKNDYSCDPAAGSLPAPDGHWKEIGLRMIALTPLSIAKRTVGNVGESLDFIPGIVLLGRVSNCIRAAGLDPFDVIAAGHLRVLPFNPEVTGKRSLPAPFCLVLHKEGGALHKAGTVFNRFEDDTRNEPQVKGIKEGFLIFGSERETLPLPVTFPKRLASHNVIEDAVQRPTSRVGGLYSYEVIEEGTRFQGALRLSAALAERLEDQLSRLKGTLSLGRSKKDDYGHVKLEIFELEESTDVVCRGTATESCEQLTVWCLSDLLIDNPRLSAAPDVETLRQALERAIKKRLGKEVRLTLRDKEGCLDAVLRPVRRESWQVAWALPRPALTGIGAGSCAVFTVEGDLDDADLQILSKEGLGERRAEGYGEVIFNHPLVSGALIGWRSGGEQTAGESSEAESPIDPSADDQALCAKLDRWAYQAAIREGALRIAPKKALDLETAPKNTQLAALRNAAHVAQGLAELGPLERFLARVEDSDKRIEDWPESLRKRLRELIENNNKVWSLLETHMPSLRPLTEESGQQARSALHVYAVTTLISQAIQSHNRTRDGDARRGED